MNALLIGGLLQLFYVHDYSEDDIRYDQDDYVSNAHLFCKYHKAK